MFVYVLMPRLLSIGCNYHVIMCWLVCGRARQSPGILRELQRGKRRLPGLERAAEQTEADTLTVTRQPGTGWGRGWCWAELREDEGSYTQLRTLRHHGEILSQPWFKWLWPDSYCSSKHPICSSDGCLIFCPDVFPILITDGVVDAPLLSTHSAPGHKTEVGGHWREAGCPGCRRLETGDTETELSLMRPVTLGWHAVSAIYYQSWVTKISGVRVWGNKWIMLLM